MWELRGFTSMMSPDGKEIGRITSEGTSIVSLQWMRVSSKSNTTVLRSMWSELMDIGKEVTFMFFGFRE